MIRILIADPDSATRKALALLLQHKIGSYTIIEVQDVETLIRALADSSPDVLLLDWRLYGSPAPETCRLLQKAYPGLKIVLLSVDRGDESAAKSAGADFIHKGASPDELIAVLKPLLLPKVLQKTQIKIRQRKENEMQTNRSNIGAFVGGTILIAFGLLSLAGQLFRTLDWSLLWSTVIILMGGCFFVAMCAIGKGASALAIPGSIVSGIGLVTLIQSITHHWESMSYFWTLIILFIGIGIYIMGWHAGDENQKRSGTRVIRAGVILFVIFGAFFELIFSNLTNIIFPILFIGAGIYLVLTRSGLLGSKKRESADPLPPAN